LQVLLEVTILDKDISTTTMMFSAYEYEHYAPYASSPCTQKSYPFLEEFKLKRPKCDTRFHVAALVVRGKVIGFATNQVASRSNGASTRGSQCHIHAEKKLLTKVPRHLLKGASIYVMRVDTKAQEFRYSQPCPECTILLTKSIKRYGIRNVYFTV